MQVDKEFVKEKLQEIYQEHRDIDEVIARLSDKPIMDQLQLQRLKKRKLSLRDMITKLESLLIDDIIA